MSTAPKYKINLNDISTVEFSIPAYIFDENTNDYVKTHLYDEVVGKKLLLIEPYGWFRIANPEIENDGIKAIKKITALSLEDELNDASISAWEGTFPLYNLTNPNDPDSVFGMIKALKPSWNIGYVSSQIWGYWRTFDISEKTLYSFLKNDVQKIYQTVIIFDTYNRTINAYTLEELATGSILAMSHDNLIKNIKTKNLDDEIITRLEVFGAGDIDIREINPRGDNYLYDFDYFMNEKWLPEETGANGLIAAWNAYKILWDSKQGLYDDLMIMYRIYNSNLLNAQTRLTLLENQWNGLKTRAKDYADYGTNTAIQTLYNQIQAQIKALEPQITTQKQAVTTAKNSLQDMMVKISVVNTELSLKNNFTSAQLATLDTITYSDEIVCDSFADVNVDFSGEPITASIINSGTLIANGGTIRQVTNSVTGISTYKLTDSNVTFSYQGQILNTTTNIVEVMTCLANVIINDGTVAMMSNGAYVCSLDVATGTIQVGSKTYPITNGIITITAASNTPSFIQDTRFQINGGAGNVYITEANTSLGRQKIIRELYAYAQDIFEKIAVPSFQFDIDSVNPFFLSDFQPVLQDFKMGNTVSVEVEESKWLRPMLLGVELDYGNEAQVSLKFSNKLRYGSNEFDFTELFNESIDRGRDSTVNRFDYLAFTSSNANNVISEYINSALDASKQLLQSSQNQEMILGGFGGIFRQANPDGTFDPKQLWLTKNMIAFTRNNWDSVAAAFGEVTLNGNSYYGLVADAVMGRKIMGNEMELMANSTNGTNVSGFTFNGNGALFNNARATWNNSNGFQIVIDPTNQLFAMGSGIYQIASNGAYTPRFNPPANISSATEWWNRSDLQGIQLFADGQGNLFLRGNVYCNNGYFKGTVYATDGEFTGKVTATSGIFKGTVQASDFLNPSGRSMLSANSGAGYKFDADFLDLKGISITDTAGRNSFSVNRSGFVTIGNGANAITYNNNTGVLSVNGNINMTSGSISWGIVNSDPVATNAANTANNAYNLANNANSTAINAVVDAAMAASNITRLANGTYYGSTFINGTSISAPYITGGRITGNEIIGSTISGSTINGSTINFGSFGSMYQGFGNDGVNTTQVVRIDSTQGIALQAGSGGLSLQATRGVWSRSPLYVTTGSGNYYDIATCLRLLADKAGISLPTR